MHISGALDPYFFILPILFLSLSSPIPVKFPEDAAGGCAPELSQALPQAGLASERWAALGKLMPGTQASLSGSVLRKLTLRSMRQGLSL